MPNKNQAIKILYVIDSYQNPNAGTEGQLFQLIKHFDRAKYQPRLLVLKESPWLSENNFPCEFDVLGASSLKSPKTWFSLYRAARKYCQQGYQLAHVYFNDSSVMCPPMFKLAGIKSLISRRDMGYWYNAFYRFILPFTGKCCAGAVVNSAAVGEITQQVEKLTPEKVTVIYNGYEISQSEIIEIERLKAFKGDSLLLGLVANIRPIKRMQDAIRALANLSGVDVKLVIIGDGEPEELLQLAESLNIKNKVLFFGASKDVKSCLQYVDIGLLCSESEGFSNAIVEYQFAGLPVVCSAVGGNPEAISHGETGFLYPASNVEKLSQCLQELVSSETLRDKFSAATLEHANKTYSVGKMIAHHEELYNKVLNS